MRFERLYRSLGLKADDVAQSLHVSLRTVHNWRAGRHPVPYMAFKLLRVQSFMELPFKGWEGWAFTGGKLVSPEGHSFVGADSSWWSLLVRRAQSFGTLYARVRELECELAQRQVRGPCTAGSAPGAATENEIFRLQNVAAKGRGRRCPDGNHGDNNIVSPSEMRLGHG